jgi:hypothetical protein
MITTVLGGGGGSPPVYVHVSSKYRRNRCNFGLDVVCQFDDRFPEWNGMYSYTSTRLPQHFRGREGVSGSHDSGLVRQNTSSQKYKETSLC